MATADAEPDDPTGRYAVELAAAYADTVQMPRPLRPRPSPRFIVAMTAAVACWLVPLVLLAVSGSRKDRQLASALSERDALQAELGALRRSWPDLPVLLLGGARGADARYAVDPRAPWVVLRVEPSAPGLAYEAALFDGVERPVWAGRLRAGADGALSVALPGTLLPAGRYRLTATAPGAAASAVRFELVRP